MHRFLLSLSLIACISTVTAQDRNAVPPETLVQSFETSYHQATHLIWKERNAGGYIASFMWDNMPTESHYNGYGEWLFTENYMTRERLPQTAQIHLRRRAGTTEPVSIGHHDAFSGSYFFVRFKNGNRFTEWRYDHGGNYIGQF